jgi:hypothetical protein
MDFLSWIESINLTRSTAIKYWGAIVGPLSKWAMHDLANVSSPSAFKAIAQAVRETDDFKDWNKSGNGMYSAALDRYEQYLTLLDAQYVESGPHADQVAEIESVLDEPFDPKGQEDARARVLRQVVQRRGQQKFRVSLIAAYGGRCAITGCSFLPLLEAAHITPYLGPDTNAITNGLLLRADIHTLWDLGLIAVEPTTRSVWISPDVNDPTYAYLSGRPLMQPLHPSQQASIAALHQQWDLVHKSTDLAESEP